MRIKNYQKAKHHTALHNFNISDVVFYANMKPNKLDSQFHPAKHVIMESQVRDTFTLVNVANGTTLIRSAKHLKRAPIEFNDIRDEDNMGSTSSK